MSSFSPDHTSPDLTNMMLDLSAGLENSTEFTDFRILYAPVPANNSAGTDAARFFATLGDDFGTRSSHMTKLNASSTFLQSETGMMLGCTQETSDTMLNSNNGNVALGNSQMRQGNRHHPVVSASSQYGDVDQTISSPTAIDWFSATSARASDATSSIGKAIKLSCLWIALRPESSPARPQDSFGNTVCVCFNQILALLRKMTPKSRLPHEAGATQDKRNRLLSFDSVIARNVVALDALSRTMKCPGPHDSSIYRLLSMIVFKTVGWYAAAATAASVVPINTAVGTALHHTSGK
ncbi:hypothetical protein LTR95_001016 [Oleoguttula sp. CCFEE 5521]